MMNRKNILNEIMLAFYHHSVDTILCEDAVGAKNGCIGNLNWEYIS